MSSEISPVVQAIELFRVYMRSKIIYTGRMKNANKLARILPLYQGFVEAHASFFVDNFSYEPVGKAGQRGEMFALFRDEILPAALELEEPGGESEGEVSTNARHVKRVKRNNGTASQRSIPGWEMRIDSEGGDATACDVTRPLFNTPSQSTGDAA